MNPMAMQWVDKRHLMYRKNRMSTTLPSILNILWCVCIGALEWSWPWLSGNYLVRNKRFIFGAHSHDSKWAYSFGCFLWRVLYFYTSDIEFNVGCELERIVGMLQLSGSHGHRNERQMDPKNWGDVKCAVGIECIQVACARPSTVFQFHNSNMIPFGRCVASKSQNTYIILV